MPLVSLCIPTNAKTEWVIPVLDSIYSSNVAEDLFEVVVEDNGDDQIFRNKIIEYGCNHSNLKYFKSDSDGFLCQIDSFKHAEGEFIKFVNHRFTLVDGSLEYLIEFANEHLHDKPVVFFPNGTLKACETDSFDEFIKGMSYYSSWSIGLAFWKQNMEYIDNLESYNSLFPHTDILFSICDSKKYIISDKVLFKEIDTSHASKGKYNLFYAFAVEYPSILCQLFRNGLISIDTYLIVKDNLLSFLADLYIHFIINKEPASYSFDDYKKYLNIYYSGFQIKRRILKQTFRKIAKRLHI